jgi:hypothetical protein
LDKYAAASKNELDAHHSGPPPNNFTNPILTTLKEGQLKMIRHRRGCLNEDLCTVLCDIQNLAFANRATLNFDPRRNTTGSSNFSFEMSDRLHFQATWITMKRAKYAL